MIQQRLTERLIAQWNLLRTNNHCPDFSKLNRGSIADIWPSCLVIRTQPKADSATPTYQYAEVGSKAETIFKENPIGQYFIPNAKIMPAARLMLKVVDLTIESSPIIDDGQFVNDKQRIVKFRSCLLPFGSSERITHVVVGLSWREF